VIEIGGLMHREKPIYQGLVPFAGEEDVLLDYSWEIDNLKELQKAHSCVRKVHMLNIGLMAVVQVRNPSDGEVPLIMEKLLSNPFIKTVIVVDDDVDPYNYGDVLWAVSTRFQAERDLLVKKDVDGLMIDPSAAELSVSDEFFSTLVAKTSKMGINATKPGDGGERFDKIDVPKGVKETMLKIVDDIF
jgi:2,5-furandicarboxylate decarboxylase 1